MYCSETILYVWISCLASMSSLGLLSTDRSVIKKNNWFSVGGEEAYDYDIFRWNCKILSVKD